MKDEKRQQGCIKKKNSGKSKQENYLNFGKVSEIQGDNKGKDKED